MPLRRVDVTAGGSVVKRSENFSMRAKDGHDEIQ
jgi:hypothetical protein